MLGNEPLDQREQLSFFAPDVLVKPRPERVKKVDVRAATGDLLRKPPNSDVIGSAPATLGRQGSANPPPAGSSPFAFGSGAEAGAAELRFESWIAYCHNLMARASSGRSGWAQTSPASR